MRLQFELIDGRIYATVYQLVWSEDDDEIVVLRDDVTDRVMPVVDDWLDEQLGLSDYKYINGKLEYVGKEKN